MFRTKNVSQLAGSILQMNTFRHATIYVTKGTNASLVSISD